MAWHFDGSSDVQLADNAALTIPNGDWAICGWFRVSSNSGTSFPRLLSWGTNGSNGSLVIFLAQDNAGVANDDELSARFIGPGGADTGVISPGLAISTVTDQWLALCLTHDNSSNTTYLRVLDRAAHTIFSDSSTIALGSLDVSDPLYFGQNNVNNFHFTGDMAEWFLIPHFLTNDAFHGFIHGGRGYKHAGCAWHVPMLAERYEEWRNQIAVTNNGTTAVYDGPQLRTITPRTPVPYIRPPGIIDLDVENTLTFTQLSEHQIKELAASNTITFSQNNQDARPKSVAAENNLSLTQLADCSLLTRTASNTLTLTQQSILAGEKPLSGENSLSLTQLAVSSLHSRTASNSLTFEQSSQEGFVSVEAIVLTAEHTISFTSLAEDEHAKASGTSLTASNAITLTGRSLIPTELTADNTINFSQTAVGNVILTASSTLSLVQDLILNRDFSLTAESPLSLTQAITYLVFRDGIPVVPSGGCALAWQYYPLVGEGSEVRSIPPTITVQDDVLLFYPDGPICNATNSLTLRTPNFGDRDRNQYARINRESRGGSLRIYRDPDWPSQRILVMDFSGVKDSEKSSILTFLSTTLGKKIGFRDWLGRTWFGVITNPDTPIIQNRRNNSDIALELEVDDTELQTQLCSNLILTQTSDMELVPA